MNRRVTLSGLLAAVVVIISACSPGGAAGPLDDDTPTQEPTEEATEAPNAGGLAGTSWVLAEMSGDTALPFSLKFEDGQVSGSACNSYGGTYTASEHGTLSISDLFSTEMACMDPVGIMEQESAYFTALNEAAAYRIEGEQLIIATASNDSALVFNAFVDPSGADTLDGTSWKVTRINGETLIPGSEITLSFSAGQIYGNAGCNEYSTTYSIGKYGASELGPVTMTKMACGDPEGVMGQETAFAQVLEAVTTINRGETELQMVSEDGTKFILLRPADDETVSMTNLAGTEWLLASLNGHSLVEGSQITLEFDVDHLGGVACNHYGGPYINGENGRFKATEIAHTDMLCSEPEGIMEQESEYHQTLMKVTSYKLEGDQLEFYSEDGGLLVFTNKPQLDMNPADLVGTTWRVVSINDTLPPADVEATLTFTSETEYRGVTGCRDFEGTYVAEGDDITSSSMGMLATEPCSDQALNDFESLFSSAVGSASDYKLEGDTLEIYDIRGGVLRLERVP